MGASACAFALQLCLSLPLLLPLLLDPASLVGSCRSSRCTLALLLLTARLGGTTLLCSIDYTLYILDPSLELRLLNAQLRQCGLCLILLSKRAALDGCVNAFSAADRTREAAIAPR